MSAVRRYMDAVRQHRNVTLACWAEISEGCVSQACVAANTRRMREVGNALAICRRELLDDLRRRANA
jgi:hypothetical protein